MMEHSCQQAYNEWIDAIKEEEEAHKAASKYLPMRPLPGVEKGPELTSDGQNAFRQYYKSTEMSRAKYEAFIECMKKHGPLK